MKLRAAKMLDGIYRAWRWAYERDYELLLLPLGLASVVFFGVFIGSTGQVLMAFVLWGLGLLAVALVIGLVVGTGKAIKWGNRTMNGIRAEEREWKRAR